MIVLYHKFQVLNGGRKFMYIAELEFKTDIEKNKNNTLDAIEYFLGALRMNGQISGREFPVACMDKSYNANIMLPDIDSLDKKYANEYVNKTFNKLCEEKIKFKFTIKGREPYSAPVCGCSSSKGYILYTTYLSLESAVRCEDCFGTIPLYKLPPTSSGEYGDILTWESDYKACDTLQMNCSTGERFAIQQMNKYDSSLSKRGINICSDFLNLSGKSMYYYLYHPKGRGKKNELARKCPSCGADWLLKETLHGFFDFRCDKCKLLSNIAWSIS